LLITGGCGHIGVNPGRTFKQRGHYLRALSSLSMGDCGDLRAVADLAEINGHMLSVHISWTDFCGLTNFSGKA